MQFKNLEEIISKSINSKVISCVGIEVVQDKENKLSLYRGTLSFDELKQIDENTYFDLASLTKPLVTTLLIGFFIDRNLISLDTKIGDFYDEYSVRLNPALSQITIGNLLSHCSGLDVRYDLFEIVNNRSDVYMFLRTRNLAYPTGTKHIYSDLDFILLGEILELLSGKKLNQLFDSYIATPLSLYNIKYLPVSKKDDMDIRNVACTGYSNVRERMLLGEVQDENTYIMDGVSGHAGLFGTAKDVTKIAEHLMDIYFERGNKNPLISSKTLKSLWTRFSDKTDWAYGWHYPTAGGVSTGGKHISPKSVGMTGFTGCSLWIDLEKQIIITILANRTISPFSSKMGGEKDKFSELRPLMHDKILEVL